jgi:hypothetical protein
MYKCRLNEPIIKANIVGMADQWVLVMIEGYAEHLKARIYRTCKEISSKCYEAVVTIKQKKMTGYGRTPQ